MDIQLQWNALKKKRKIILYFKKSWKKWSDFFVLTELTDTKIQQTTQFYFPVPDVFVCHEQALDFQASIGSAIVDLIPLVIFSTSKTHYHTNFTQQITNIHQLQQFENNLVTMLLFSIFPPKSSYIHSSVVG
jgi:hypothetical protein